MFSLFLVVLGLINGAVAASALRLWQESRSTILLFAILPQLGVTLATLLAGAGRWIGAGEQLRSLAGLPMLIAYLTVPLSLFTFATLSRRYGFAWARIDWGHGAVCIGAVLLLAYDLTWIITVKLIYPACWQDVVWYLRSVPPALACADGQEGVGVPAEFPVTLASALVAYLGLGIGLWRQQGWPVLGVMALVGAPLLLLPAAWGPLPAALGASLCWSGFVLATCRYVRAAPPPQTVAEEPSA